MESGRHIDYHLRLSEILREFVGRSFSFHALEMTSQEIMQALARIPDDTDPFVDAIRTKLDEMDMVKFAKAMLPLDESRELLSSTCELVVAMTEQLNERDAVLAMQSEETERAESLEVPDALPVGSLPESIWPPKSGAAAKLPSSGSPTDGLSSDDQANDDEVPR